MPDEKNTTVSVCVDICPSLFLDFQSIFTSHQPYPHPVPVYHIQGMAVTKGFSHLGEETTGFHLRKATSVADGAGWLGFPLLSRSPCLVLSALG